MSTEKPRYGRIDREYGMRLAITPPDEDGPVWMVNLMKYRDVAEYADGRKSTMSGREADDLYAPMASLAAVGAEVVFLGDADQQLLGDGVNWDRVAVVKYPTRRGTCPALPRCRGGGHHTRAHARVPGGGGQGRR